MDLKDIINRVSSQNSTILSFPDRGPWGDNKYRGNCSGYIHAFLIWRYKIKKLAELFAGSGTGYDVAKDMGISYTGADLNPNPVRTGILNINAIYDEVPDDFRDADMVFMHPPYGKEIGISYAGAMYDDVTGELSKSDLGQMPWKQFMHTLNEIILKYYSAMAPGSHMAVLMGDIRRGGRFYSMLSDIVKPGELQQIIIKEQHNTVSESRVYTGSNFTPINHEFLMVIKKVFEAYIFNFSLPTEYSLDIRSMEAVTWTDLVKATLYKLGGQARLQSIYYELKDCAKSKNNRHPEEKIRQTLQTHPNLFKRIDIGLYKMAV